MVSLGIFSVVPPTEPCALRSTQPLKVSTRDFYLGEGGRCFWLTIYHPCSAEKSTKFGVLNYPEPLGPLRPVAGDLYFTSVLLRMRNVFRQICSDFDRVSSFICGKKMPARCNRGFYCRSYCLLNMFRALHGHTVHQ